MFNAAASFMAGAHERYRQQVKEPQKVNICEGTEREIQDAKKLADDIWKKHVDTKKDISQEDSKALMHAIWLINGMYEGNKRDLNKNG